MAALLPLVWLAYLKPGHLSCSGGNAREVVVKVMASVFMQALEDYYSDTGRYPSPPEGLEALRVPPVNASGWNGPYLPKRIPDDPWGRPYRYHPPDREHTKPFITSDGPPR